jgi:hypothetical protein
LVVAILVAFGAGFWAERRRTQAVEFEASQLRAQLAQTQAALASAEARVRLGALLGQILVLEQALAERNYGVAQELSTRFFDDVRAESDRTPDAAFRQALEGILGVRDAYTASLTRIDSASLEMLRGARSRIRQALGYPLSWKEATAPAAGPAASPSPAASPEPSPAATPGTSPTPSPESPQPSPAPEGDAQR